MIKALDVFWRFVIRFRYPLSQPEDIARDLGFMTSNFIPFSEFIQSLTDPRLRLPKLSKFMPRDQAEELFQTALRREIFKQNSLFSYHLNGGWMEFMLQFDEQARLRRIYIHHKDLKHKYELPIS